MGRPLTARIKPTSTGFQVSVPTARGAKSRISHTFPTEEEAARWRDAAIAALTANRPVPDPAHFVSVPTKTRRGPTSPRFAEVAWAFYEDEYARNLNRSAETVEKAETLIRLWLVPYFDRAVSSVGEIRRIDVREFILVASGLEPFAGPPAGAPSLQAARRTEWLSPAEAAELCGLSKSEIGRRVRAGEFPNAVLPITGPFRGRWRIPAADLAAAKLPVRSGPVRPGRIEKGIGSGGASVRYQREMLQLLRFMLTWAADHGLASGDPTHGVVARKPPPAIALRRPDTAPPRPFTLKECLKVGAELHVHHYLVLLLQRVMGLRVSEVYGLTLADVLDDGLAGEDRVVLRIKAQGGRTFKDRGEDGSTVRSKRRESTKTTAGIRHPAVPRQLTSVLRAYIEAFHTDPATGELDESRRLVVSVRSAEDGGVAGYRQALNKAFAACGLGFDEVQFLASTHQLRHSISSDMLFAMDVSEAARSWILGHGYRGDGKGSAVTALHYSIRPKALEPLIKATEEIEHWVDDETDGLVVALQGRATYARSHYLRQPDWAPHSERVLTEVGLHAQGDAELTVLEVAEELEVSVKTVRRLLDEGKIRARRTKAGVWLVARHELEQYQEEAGKLLPLSEVAARLGTSIWALHRRKEELPLLREGSRYFLHEDDLPACQEHLSGVLDLEARAVTRQEAARELRVSVVGIKKLVRKGLLEDDPGSPPSAPYVTRESLQRELQRRASKLRFEPFNREEWLTLDEVKERSGLTRQLALRLRTDGVRVRNYQQRYYLHREDFEAWLAKRQG
jgi:excisionase family DNA binding protein